MCRRYERSLVDGFRERRNPHQREDRNHIVWNGEQVRHYCGEAQLTISKREVCLDGVLWQLEGETDLKMDLEMIMRLR